MNIAIIHRLDDTYIETAWKHAETAEIEDLAAALLGKAQEAQSIEDDLFSILYLAFRCGFTTAIGQQLDMRDEMNSRRTHGHPDRRAATADTGAGNSAGSRWPRESDSVLVADVLSTRPR